MSKNYFYPKIRVWLHDLKIYNSYFYNYIFIKLDNE